MEDSFRYGGNMKKHCWIRGDEKEKKCPFGLPITLACNNAGNSVTHMCPLEAVSDDRVKAIINANKRVYLYMKTGDRCLYAHNIMDKVQAVNCDFGDVGAGMDTPAFSGSPLYAQTFSGVGLDGLYAFPLGFYGDNNSSRNLFQGLFSLLGVDSPEIVKEAVGEGIWEKMEKGDALSADERETVISMLEKCRQEFEDDRTDPQKVEELSRRWNSKLR
jgi:hypothetical protein